MLFRRICPEKRQYGHLTGILAWKTPDRKVCNAIEKAHGVSSVDKGEQGEPVSQDLLIQLGLAGGEGSSEKRGRAGALLGTGYGNTKSFLNKLNRFGITRDQLIEAVEKGNI